MSRAGVEDHDGAVSDSAIEIRRVAPGEWRAMRDLRLRSLAEDPEAFSTELAEAKSRPEESWRGLVDGKRGDDQAIFVAVDRGQFVGMVAGFVPDADPGVVYVGQMWTAPEARRAGIGIRLLCAVVAMAGDRAVRLAVMRGNDAARTLYESAGFVPDDRPPLPDDPCPEELHMVREPAIAD